MADIKTRASLRTIKTLDRTQTLAQKTKEGVQGLNREAEQTQSEGYESADEYADDQLESKEKTIARTVTFGAVRLAQKGMKKGRKAIEKRIKNGRKKPDLKVNQPKQLKPPARKALPAPNPAKTAEKSAKVAKKAAKAAKETAKASKRAAEAAKKAAEYTAKAAQATVKAVIAACKAVVAAVKGIVAAIAAGGWVAVVIIIVIVVVAGLVIATFNGAFIPSDDGTTPLYEVQNIEREFLDRRDALIYEIPHDTYEIVGNPADDQEVIAVYLAKVNFDKDSLDPGVKMTEENIAELRRIYFDMNRLYTVEEERRELQYVTGTDENGEETETVIERITTCLVVTIEPYSVEEMADRYNFTAEQREALNIILYEAPPAW